MHIYKYMQAAREHVSTLQMISKALAEREAAHVLTPCDAIAQVYVYLVYLRVCCIHLSVLQVYLYTWCTQVDNICIRTN